MGKEEQRPRTGQKIPILETQQSWPKKGSHHDQTMIQSNVGGLEQKRTMKQQEEELWRNWAGRKWGERRNGGWCLLFYFIPTFICSI